MTEALLVTMIFMVMTAVAGWLTADARRRQRKAIEPRYIPSASELFLQKMDEADALARLERSVLRPIEEAIAEGEQRAIDEQPPKPQLVMRGKEIQVGRANGRAYTVYADSVDDNIGGGHWSEQFKNVTR